MNLTYQRLHRVRILKHAVGTGDSEVRGQRTEQKGKRTHGHRQQCGDCCGEGSTRGPSGNGKTTIKIKFLKEF